ncbi:hypothetical protein OB920_18820 [Halobacteria archaeon HArc-gm2]|nr:hypothetical protein [Halobacteria archaeon HArc-gm2]
MKDEDACRGLDLSPATRHGKVYRFLLENAERTLRKREIVAAVDVPQGSVGPTLKRLGQHDVVDQSGQSWTIADPEHAVASAGFLSSSSTDDIDGGFSDEEVETWMISAVDPIPDDDEA